MKRRLLYLTVTLFAAACLSGCHQKDPEPGDIAGYDEGEEYLSIWVHSIEDTEEGQAYKESVETFNEAYDGQYFADIEFVPRNDSGGGYSDKVNASVMAGGLPDVLTVDGPNISAYAANGIIQPLADLTEEEESEYLPSIIEQGTVNDDLYALGVMESSVGFYYNKDIIEEAGIEIPDADHPWTWSEFLDILEELKPIMDEKGGYPLDMTFPVGETSIYYYAPFVWSGGGELVSDDGLTVDGYFNSDQTKAAMEYFRTIVENGYMSQAPIDNLFESGRAAFKFDGAWEVNTIYTSETKDIEGATELVKWMSGVDSGIRIWNMTKNFPSTYEAFENIDVFQTDENYSALYNQLSTYGHPRPKTPVYPQVSTSFQEVLESVALSGKDVDQELDKAVERIDQKLERYTRE